MTITTVMRPKSIAITTVIQLGGDYFHDDYFTVTLCGGHEPMNAVKTTSAD